jgi:chemotaxis protein MotB
MASLPAQRPAPPTGSSPPGPGRPSNDTKPVAPVIIKKITVVQAAGHHGGAWKVAYADFVTAMMAFFLLLWIVGATNEDQRKGIADYFTPTLVTHKNSGGSNGVLGGRSILRPDGNATYTSPNGQARMRPVAGPTGRGVVDGEKSLDPQAMRQQDEESFRKVRASLEAQIRSNAELAGLLQQVRFVPTDEGLRIELVDKADFSMFEIGTDRLVPRAAMLVAEAATAASGVPNRVAIRGHTDSIPYAFTGGMNNWLLSAQRAERTRRSLADNGIHPARFARLEGVADTEPFNAANPYDPRNRRISVTLLYREVGPE